MLLKLLTHALLLQSLPHLDRRQQSDLTLRKPGLNLRLQLPDGKVTSYRKNLILETCVIA